MKRLLFLINFWIFNCWIFSCSLQGQQISYAEYFIDQDPGLGNAIPFSFVPGEDAEITHTIPVNGIDNGLHLLYARVRDDAGAWSGTEHFAFFVKSLSGLTISDIRQAEYFFNQDPGPGKAQPLSFSEDSRITVHASLPLSDIPEGINTLYIRLKDGFDTWSHTSHYTFLVQRLSIGIPPDIRSIEFFIDEDPGPGNGNDIAFEMSDRITVAAELPMTDIPEGIHTLFLRAKDHGGTWGTVSHFNFLVQKLPGKFQTEINGMEYYFDTDPGYGMGYPIEIQAERDVVISPVIPIESLHDGMHTLYVRARDKKGQWGMVFHSNFLKVEKLMERNEIIAMEYFLNEDPGFGKGTPVPLNTAREVSRKYFVVDGNGLQPGKNMLFVRSMDVNRTWGHTYTAEFEVLENGACSPPTNLIATEVTETGAKLGWSSDTGTNAWDVLWVEKGQDYTEDGVLKNNSEENPLQATLLRPSTLYNFYVRSWCSDGQVSEWADPAVFHTLPLAVNALTLEADPPSGGSCTGGGSYPWGENLAVTAHPNQGYIFSHWTGDTAFLDHPGMASATLVMPDFPVTLTAHFIDITGVEGNHGIHLQVYPVPANEALWVEYDHAGYGETTLQLINLQGKAVSQFELAGPGLHKIHIETSAILPGLYFLKLDGPMVHTTRKIIIIR